jgi:hypothetical protein
MLKRTTGPGARVSKKSGDGVGVGVGTGAGVGTGVGVAIGAGVGVGVGWVGELPPPQLVSSAHATATAIDVLGYALAMRDLHRTGTYGPNNTKRGF